MQRVHDALLVRRREFGKPLVLLDQRAQPRVVQRFDPLDGGDQTVALGPGNNLTQKVYSNYVKTPLGTRPAYPGKKPPYKPDVPCYTNKLPDVNGAATGPPDGSGG